MASTTEIDSRPTSDRAALACVLLTWLAAAVAAAGLVIRYGPRFPFGDESDLWHLLPPSGSLSWRELWAQKNEHHVPLPRLLQYVAYVLTRDLRAPMLLEVALLGGTALLLIAVARRIRGRTVIADTIYPLLWLTTGNWFNLLSGFQLSLMLPTAIAAALLGSIAVSSERPGAARAAGIGAGLVALPLCGGVGIVQAPALAAWTAWTGWTGRRSPVREERIGSGILLASAALTLALGAVYFLDYSRPRWYSYAGLSSTVIASSATVLATGLGPAAALGEPTIGLLALATTIAALGALATVRARASGETLRRLGFAASIAGILGLALSIGVSRVDAYGPVPRYFALAAPLYSCAHLAWTAYGAPRVRSLACGALALVAWAAVPGNVRAGETAGSAMRGSSRRFEALLAGGADPAEVVRAYTEIFPYHFAARSEWILPALAARRDPPFDRGGAPSPESLSFRALGRLPSRIESDDAVATRSVGGCDVLVVHAGTAIHFELAEGNSRITGRFGVPVELYAGRPSIPMHVRVELRSPDGSTRALLDRELDPDSNESDRGSQSFEIDGLSGSPGEPPGEIVLRVDRAESSGSAPAPRSWAYWSDVRIQ